MKTNTRTKSLITTTLLAALTAVSANAATLAFGTKIGIDFGPTDPTNNFNDTGNALTGSIAAGSVIETTTGDTVTGVGFTWGGGGNFSNDDAATESELAGQPSQFNDSNLTDWLGSFNNGSITLNFSGLDDVFTYGLVIGAGFTGPSDTSTNWVGGANSVSGSTIKNASGADAWVTLTGLTTDGSGNLAITGTGAASTPVPVVAALELTAIPEPSAALLGGLGLLALLRRRR